MAKIKQQQIRCHHSRSRQIEHNSTINTGPEIDQSKANFFRQLWKLEDSHRVWSLQWNNIKWNPFLFEHIFSNKGTFFYFNWVAMILQLIIIKICWSKNIVIKLPFFLRGGWFCPSHSSRGKTILNFGVLGEKINGISNIQKWKFIPETIGLESIFWGETFLNPVWGSTDKPGTVGHGL